MEFDFIAKQVYKITYPTGKIYIGKDEFGSFRYFGSPDAKLINRDFLNLPKEKQMKYSVEKEILWESKSASSKELSEKEVEFIKRFNSNNPEIGYNQWPLFKGKNS